MFKSNSGINHRFFIPLILASMVSGFGIMLFAFGIYLAIVDSGVKSTPGVQASGLLAGYICYQLAIGTFAYTAVKKGGSRVFYSLAFGVIPVGFFFFGGRAPIWINLLFFYVIAVVASYQCMMATNRHRWTNKG